MARKYAEIEKEILSDPKRREEIEKEQDAMRTVVGFSASANLIKRARPQACRACATQRDVATHSPS